MTPQEHIDWVRREYGPHDEHLEAVCDLAERALLTDDETEAVRTFIEWNDTPGKITAVLRRLLAEERVEHRLVSTYVGDTQGNLYPRCSCRQESYADTLDAAVRAWSAHAGIGHD